MKSCIVYICVDYTKDKRYCLFLKNSIVSFLKYYKDSGIDMYILHIGKDSYINFKFPYNVNYVDVSGFYNDMKPYFENCYEKLAPAFLKIIIPKLDFFYKYDNVLYVDLDIEFRSNKLLELFNIPDDGNEIIAISEYSMANGRKALLKSINNYELINLKHPYVNTGLILFKPKNLTQKIVDEYYRKLLEINYYNLKFLYKPYLLGKKGDIWEQTIINIVYKIKAIHDARFNCDMDINDLIIKHYCGIHKMCLCKKLQI